MMALTKRKKTQMMRAVGWKEAWTRVCALAISVLLFAGSGLATSTEKTLYSSIPYPLGFVPQGNMVADAQGSLYGATSEGGVSTCNYGLGCGTIFKLARGSNGHWQEEILLNLTGPDGAEPINVVLDAAGNVYAITAAGGSYNYGTVVEVTPTYGDKWAETVLYSFTGGSDGGQPVGLVIGPTGNLYGTTYSGGNGSEGTGCGAIFQLTPSSGGGWTESTAYAFADSLDACHPDGIPVVDEKGDIFGTTYDGGTSGLGAAFALSSTGEGQWQEAVIYSFSGEMTAPNSLVAAPNGVLYGTSYFGGGEVFDGAVFELAMKANGQWTLTSLYGFTGGADGDVPQGLILDSAGNLYGTTYRGGGSSACTDGCGTVYKLTPGVNGGWNETVLQRFENPVEGAYGAPGLLFDASGNLYGATFGGGSQSCANDGYEGCGTVFEMTPSDSGLTSYVIFRFPNKGGVNPDGALVADSSGNLYGTTETGGSFGEGTVFELVLFAGGEWHAKILYSFAGGTDGAVPQGALIFGPMGALYGTTSAGGTGQCDAGTTTCGTVFRLTPNSEGEWTESVLHRFAGGNDGGVPVAGVIVDDEGNLYGTTSAFGSSACSLGNQVGCGTVFELSSAPGQWTETILHTFAGSYGDGAVPMSGLLFDRVGNLYGTTVSGGRDDAGTVFELMPNGNRQWTERLLYAFTNGIDGAGPYGGLVFDKSGNLYGAAQLGRPTQCSINLSCGAVFELSPTGDGWNETTLYDFMGVPSDGANPVGPLVFDNAGNLYGVTNRGGVSSGPCYPFGCGTVFELTPASGGGWTENILYSFTFGDGNNPSGVILDGVGNLYGATLAGGLTDNGVAFEVNLAPR